MPKRRGRGRPKGSGVQNCQESVHGNLNSDNIPSNMVEVSSGGEELEEAGLKGSTNQKNHQQNTDGKLDVFTSMVAFAPGCKFLSDTILFSNVLCF